MPNYLPGYQARPLPGCAWHTPIEHLGFVACIRIWLGCCQGQARIFQGSSPYVARSPSKATPLPHWKNACAQSCLPNIPSSGQQQQQSTCVCFLPSFLASQAHCTPACPPRARTRCSVQIVFILPFTWMSLLPRRACLFTQYGNAEETPGPLLNDGRLLPARAAPEHARPHWHVAARRDASHEARSLITTHRHLKGPVRMQQQGPKTVSRSD